VSVALYYNNGQAAARDQSNGRGELSLSESSVLCFYVFFCILWWIVWAWVLWTVCITCWSELW